MSKKEDGSSQGSLGQFILCGVGGVLSRLLDVGTYHGIDSSYRSSPCQDKEAEPEAEILRQMMRSISNPGLVPSL